MNAKKNKHPFQRRFDTHKSNAKSRGIEFLLTFEQWFKIWTDSGHLHERGNRGHQYCMARLGDKGPYAVGNVKIITCNQNHSAQELSPDARGRIAFAHIDNQYALGYKQSAEQRAAKSASLLGNTHGSANKGKNLGHQNLLGYKFTGQNLVNHQAGQARRWEKYWAAKGVSK